MDMMTTKEICEMLKITKRTLRRWIASGKFPEPVRINSRVSRWRRDIVEDWMAEAK